MQFASVEALMKCCVKTLTKIHACFPSPANLRNLSILPGTGFPNYCGGIIEVDLIHNNQPIKAVICDLDRRGKKVGADTLCYLVGR